MRVGSIEHCDKRSPARGSRQVGWHRLVWAAATLFALLLGSVAEPIHSNVGRGLSSLPPLYVSVGGSDTGDCTSSASPCATLLYAVETIAAVTSPLNDVVTIMLGPGQFPSSSCGAVSTRPLSIVGSGSLHTTVDCGLASPLLSTSSSIEVSNLTIVNGFNTGDGGAVSVQYSGVQEGNIASFTSVTIMNCTSGGNGGAISIERSDDLSATATLRSIHIMNSTAGQSGGGVYIGFGGPSSLASLANSVFTGNSAGNGGGAFISLSGFNSTIAVDDCGFISNNASESDAGEGGGGLYTSLEGNFSAIRVNGSSFVDNLAVGSGGGLYANVNSSSISTMFQGGQLIGNYAGWRGGGICCISSGNASNASLVFSDFTAVNNSASWLGAYHQHDEFYYYYQDPAYFAALNHGGAVYAESGGKSSSQTFVNGTFIGNSAAQNGGGLSALLTGNLSIIRMVGGAFLDNSAGYGGGGLYAQVSGSSSRLLYDGGQLNGNSAGWLGGGGISVFTPASANNFTASFSGLTAATNFADGSGGVISANIEGDSCELTIVDGIFVNNSVSYGYGGGVSAQSYGSAARQSFANCALVGNTAGIGGGLALSSYGSASAQSVMTCSLTGNSAGYGGGGIYTSVFGSNSSFTISDSTMNGNTAGGNGGALSAEADGESCELTLVGSSFVANNASSNGGGVSMSSFGGTSFQSVSNCTLTGNSAGNGGGGMSSSLTGNNNAVTLNNSALSGNVAVTNGGAVSIEQTGLEDEIATVILKEVSLSNNSAKLSGGGACVKLLGYQSQVSFAGSTLSGNLAHDGAGASLTMSGLNSTIAVNTSWFIGNVAANNGGGILLASSGMSSSLMMDGSRFSGNMAGQYAGGIYTVTTGEATDIVLLNCVLTNNYASHTGGYYANLAGIAAVLLLRNTSFIINVSQFSAGGMYLDINVDDTKSSFFACSFLSNQAGNHAGGIRAEFDNGNGNTVSFSGCTFTNNTSNHNGGAVWSDNWGARDTITFEDSVFMSNVAGDGGGINLIGYGGWSDFGVAIVRNCQFVNNTAAGTGGGLVSEHDGRFSTFLIEESNFTGNVATYGGAIKTNVVGDGANVTVRNFAAGGFNANIGGVRASISFVNTSFIHNTASYDAGGMSIGIYNSEITSSLTACKFINNTAGNNGGGMHVDTGPSVGDDHTLLFTDCLIYNNSGTSDGGGVYYYAENKKAVLLFEDSEISSNTARTGGAIAVSWISTQVDVVNKSVAFQNCSMVSNRATSGDGGAIVIYGDGSSTTLSLINCELAGNSAGGRGGAIAIEGFAYAGSAGAIKGLISIQGCRMSSNTAAVVGGAIFVSTPVDSPVNLRYCDTQHNPQFREWTSNTTVAISNTAIVNNSVVCKVTCSGGGIAMSSGGELIISQSTITGNSALSFGGGLLFGGTSSGQSSCSLTLSGSYIGNNSAQQAGSQLYNNCGGKVIVDGTTIALFASNVEVVMPLAGQVSFSNSTLQCPQATLFVDAFGGLYGTGAYESTFASPWDAFNPAQYGGEPCQYSTSTLQFGCSPCPAGTYALTAGHSDGTPSVHGNGSSGGTVNPVCALCPFGGACSSVGAVVAQPGYWGAASSNGNVSFAVCPAGYCCPDHQSCSSINECDGGRMGPLCGDCGPDLVQSVLSPACVPVDRCGQKTHLFWICVALGVISMAFMQLLFVSNLLPHIQYKIRFGAKTAANYVVTTLSSRLPSRFVPAYTVDDPNAILDQTVSTSAVVKVVVYFSQMSVYVALASSSLTQVVLEDIRAVFSAQLPAATSGSLHDLCGVDTLTSLSKVKLSGLLPFAVAAAMLIILFINKLIMSESPSLPVMACCKSFGWCRPQSTREPTPRPAQASTPTGGSRVAIKPYDANPGIDCMELVHLDRHPKAVSSVVDLEAEGSVPVPILHAPEVDEKPTSVLPAPPHLRLSVHSIAESDDVNDGRLISNSDGPTGRRPAQARIDGVSHGHAHFSTDIPANDHGVNTDPTVMVPTTVAHAAGISLRPKYIAAVINFLLTVYSSFLLTIVALLHCVHVPGTDPTTTRLFIQGSVQCSYGGWQAIYVFAAVVLLAMPLCIPIASLWVTRQDYHQSTFSKAWPSAPEARDSWKRDVTLGLDEALMSPYRAGLPWWEAVLLLHRLSLAFLYTFASDAPAEQSMLAILVCGGFFALHVHARPFAHAKTQRVQTALLLSLSVMSVARMFSSSLLQLGTTPDALAIANTNTFCSVLSWVFQYAVPAAVLILPVKSSKRSLKKGRQAPRDLLSQSRAVLEGMQLLDVSSQ